MEESFLYGRPRNYRQEANFIMAFFIGWTHHIFKEGNKRDLYENDLPEPLNEHKASILGDKISQLWSEEHKYATERKRVPNLTKVLFKCFAFEYFMYGLALAFIELLVKPVQPMFIGLLLRYFSLENANNKHPDTTMTYFKRLIYYSNPDQSMIKTEEAVFYAFGIVLCSLISVCVQHPYMLAVMHLGMKVRVACMSLMYRKTLRMSLLALSPTTVGNIINLMSNDVTRFDIVTMFLHYLWISPLQLIMFMYMLNCHIGPSAYIGSIIILVFIPIQIILAYLNKKLRYITALKTDERVRLMNEIISGIQVIKMYAWEHAFCKLINISRRHEMSILVKTSYIRGLVMSMMMFTSRTAIFITLIAFVLIFEETINSEIVFLVIGYYIIMRSSMTVFFPQGVTQFAETIISIKRTRDYLLNEEAIIGDTNIMQLKTSTPVIKPTGKDNAHRPAAPSIRIIEAYARWNEDYVLKDVEIQIKNGELVVIIGQVGSGKSSLLHVILKELPVCEGYVSVKGKVSFASGEPWLFAGSVRQNIVFGHYFDRERYRNVCRACALLKDFQLLPYGDQTVVGERGISLSGGQRARISLARCVYQEADIYILDDPLSAVDAHVGNEIFERCITNFLSDKIRVLSTHQLQYLHNVDQLVIMENGRILAKGTYHELQSSGLDFAQYLEHDSDEKPKPIIIDDVQKMPFIKKLSLAETSAEAFYEEKQQRESLIETRGTGIVTCALYNQYISAGGNCCCISILVFLFIAAQFAASATDYILTQWTKVEETKHNPNMETFGVTPSLSSNECILSYGIFIYLLVISSIARSFMFFYVGLRASIKLHDLMLESVMFGRMRFFNNNPSGRIINRFAKDMGTVDEDLPYAMIDFIQMFLNLIAVLIMMGFINYFLILPVTLVTIGIVFLRQYYLRTSRSIKRVEGTVRSYVYAHLNASIQGLSTIRSHAAEVVLTYEFDKLMDLHSSAWYLFIATSRAFSVWTDMMCISFIALTSFGFLFLEQVIHLKIMAGDVGLAVTQSLTLTGLIPWGMRQSAEMENNMTSVERINDFIEIDQEPELRAAPHKQPPKAWPEFGEIVFQDAEMKYGPKEAPVLRSLNLIIAPEEKIGIVGRTGAGKSSLISALFRLAFHSGAIYIDGINIFDIGLHDLREKIAIIPQTIACDLLGRVPYREHILGYECISSKKNGCYSVKVQEPIIFTGSLRFNLDPYYQYSDVNLLAALSVVELETNTSDILNKPLVEGGSNFSTGEKQLLCLARAIVRNNKILILDEATANMDAGTDKLIQTTIRSKFTHCTVLTIAHRLHTIMDSDRVLVMNAGMAVEFDQPHVLLSDNNGYFTSMVNQTGRITAEFLKKIAENSYNDRRSTRTSEKSTHSFNEEEIV